MAYKRVMRRQPPKKKGLLGLLGLGDTFTTNTPCANIPAGDPYRVPGNYCTNKDGVWSTFTSAGELATPSTGGGSSSSSDSGGGGFWDVIGKVLSQGAPSGPAPNVPPRPAGMSSTTKIALAAGGALLLVVLLKD